ncbi:MAG: VCBS repeat-containing protein [Phycisphaerae bacterium]|nr:VCBS repeat-containing protein [Phycisphaerae bacterium]
MKWADIRDFAEEEMFPGGVAAGDTIGNDGLPDIAVGTSSYDLWQNNWIDHNQPGKITVLENTGYWAGDTTGLTIFQQLFLPTTAMVSDIAFADVDNDGDLDLVAVAARTTELGGAEEPGLYVFERRINPELNQNDFKDEFAYYGFGTYAMHGLRGMAVADFNNDGYVDVAAAVDGFDYFEDNPNQILGGDKVYLYQNKGGTQAGLFELKPPYEFNFYDSNNNLLDFNTHEIVAADFHRLTLGQPRLDLVTANMQDGFSISHMRNTGNNASGIPIFQSTRVVPCSDPPILNIHDLAVARFRSGSSHEDVAAFLPGLALVLRGNSRGEFAYDCDTNPNDPFSSPSAYFLEAAGCSPCGASTATLKTGGIATGHLNGGTKPDIAASACGEYVAILLGKGDGTMQFDCTQNVYYPTVSPAPTNIFAHTVVRLLIVDMNQDGFGDIVTVNNTSSGPMGQRPYVSVLLNQLNVGGGQ